MSEELFNNKTLSDVFADIYANTNAKRDQLTILIEKMVKTIRSPEDMIIIMPIVKDLMEVSVKNDEHLVRLAQIAQRMETSAKKASTGDLLTDEEKEELLKNLNAELEFAASESKEIDNTIEDILSTVKKKYD